MITKYTQCQRVNLKYYRKPAVMIKFKNNSKFKLTTLMEITMVLYLS